MKKILTIGFLALVLAVAAGSAANAATVPTPPTVFGATGIPGGITTAGGFIQIILDLTDWLFIILLVVSVIMIVLAGLQFITGGGDPAAISAARTKLIWAAVGIGVALLAKGIPSAVSNLLGT